MQRESMEGKENTDTREKNQISGEERQKNKESEEVTKSGS